MTLHFEGKSLGRLLLVAVSVVVLQACVSSSDELERYIAEVKLRPADPIEPIPPVTTYVPHVYESSDKRNPFVSETSEEETIAEETDSGTGIRPDPNRVKEYLEQYSLDTLDMVGTFSKDGVSWSLIEDPDGVIHRVAVNNYLGQNHGRVIGIFPDRVDLVELISNGAGGWLEREASIALE